MQSYSSDKHLIPRFCKNLGPRVAGLKNKIHLRRAAIERELKLILIINRTIGLQEYVRRQPQKLLKNHFFGVIDEFYLVL